ncbi:PREDICTED: methyltransferase-like protein 7A [Pygoscelis adeliae]|uniref:methyltransferase-like protein 7A n=1 Tax=Pygoscelis adeliae TaxID=9238 RepID=UPI0004F4F2C1|nr:PREDICTED: methyltransferase-like protein 7A [Pygoscelis adeliae]
MALASFLRRCVQLLLSPIHVLACLGLWDSFYKKVFPYVMAKVAPICNQKVYKQKQKLFSNLRKFAGPSGQLMLLEIGTGTGTNFQFYPPGCRLTCADPNPDFRKFLLKSLSENQHLKLEHLVVASGEDLHQIPDSAVDVVVCTLVLCSVTNIKKVLTEVLRVLRLVSWGSAREIRGAHLCRGELRLCNWPEPPCVNETAALHVAENLINSSRQSCTLLQSRTREEGVRSYPPRSAGRRKEGSALNP